MSGSINLNGRPLDLDVAPRVLLVEWIRQQGMTGTHVGCDTSACGACTVLLDGQPVKSCTMLALQASGGTVTTIEGLTPPDDLSILQKAFIAEHGLQCGFCTPGFIVAATPLLGRTDSPTDDEIRRQLEGNLCRCTGYTSIVRAVRHAAALMRGESPQPLAGLAHEQPLSVTPVHSGPVHEDLSTTEVV